MIMMKEGACRAPRPWVKGLGAARYEIGEFGDVQLPVPALLVAPVEEGDELDMGAFSGQVIAAAREAVRGAVMSAGPRLVEAKYLCVVSTSAEALSGTYAVLSKRRARILSEEMNEGTGAFIVTSYMPVAASFGFVSELRGSTSGAADSQTR